MKLKTLFSSSLKKYKGLNMAYVSIMDMTKLRYNRELQKQYYEERLGEKTKHQNFDDWLKEK